MTAQTTAVALTGLVEVHSHLLPGRDDGSRSVAESLAIARRLVDAGYAHHVCTPHIWPSLPDNTIPSIRAAVAALQAELDAAGIPLRLYEGAEINLSPRLLDLDPDSLPTYAGLGRHYLVDIWTAEWESWLTPVLRRLQATGRTVILAHPERLELVQDRPDQAARFLDMGLLLQGNLYCFIDDPSEPTRQTADLLLQRGQYFMLGGDIHSLDALDCRLEGLQALLRRLGPAPCLRLLRDNPMTLLRATPNPPTPHTTAASAAAVEPRGPTR